MLKKLKDMLRMNRGQGLPTTSGNSSSSTYYNNSVFTTGRIDDGSARGIRVRPSLKESWQRTPVPMQRTFIAAVSCLVLMYVGWRTIRYQNGYVHFNCNSQDCHIKVQPLGWRRGKELWVSRRQLVDVLNVKTLKDGTLVTDEDVRVDSLGYSRKDKKGKYKKSPKSSYKGPDEDGNYLSYEFILRDNIDEIAYRRRRAEDLALKRAVGGTIDEDDEKDKDDELNEIQREKPLDALLPFLEKTLRNERDEPTEYRLIVRKFRVASSRRRLRTMVQKVSSYIKRRRQKLIVKENAPPSWQGILMLVLGLVGFLLSILLGQLWEEDHPQLSYQQQRKLKQQQRQRQKQRNATAGGPGARRRPAQEPPAASYPVRGNSRTAGTTRKRF